MRRTGVALLGLGVLAAGCGGGGGDGGGVVNPGNPTLLDVQTQVFTPRCALSGCHTGSGAPFGLNLSAGNSGANLVGVPSGEQPAQQRVKPFAASESYLYWKVTGDSRITGDPMPLNATALSASDLGLIEDWINQGAQ